MNATVIQMLHKIDIWERVIRAKEEELIELNKKILDCPSISAELSIRIKTLEAKINTLKTEIRR